MRQVEPVRMVRGPVVELANIISKRKQNVQLGHNREMDHGWYLVQLAECEPTDELEWTIMHWSWSTRRDQMYDMLWCIVAVDTRYKPDQYDPHSTGHTQDIKKSVGASSGVTLFPIALSHGSVRHQLKPNCTFKSDYFHRSTFEACLLGWIGSRRVRPPSTTQPLVSICSDQSCTRIDMLLAGLLLFTTLLHLARSRMKRKKGVAPKEAVTGVCSICTGISISTIYVH
jgi:hypothetical protein